jgi:hypothetical protein
VNRAARPQHPLRLLQNGDGIAQVLHHPHQPHSVDLIVGPGQCCAIAYDQLNLVQAESLKMALGRFDLRGADVDPQQLDIRIGQADLAEHGSYAAPDFQQSLPRLQHKVGAQQRAELLGLIDQALLLARAGAVDVSSHVPCFSLVCIVL